MSLETASEPRIPEATDRDEIVRVVNLYIDAFGTGTPEMFREAFHPSARIYFTFPDGTLYQGRLYGPPGEDFGPWPTSPRHQGRVIEVVQAGDVACAVLAMGDHGTLADGSDGWWLDIHTLLRLDGTWKDMSKTATHASRADWAGLEPPGRPAAPDRDEIVRVVNLYNDGFQSGKPDMFEEAFHPAAHYYWTRPDGSLQEGLVSDKREEWSKDHGGHVEAKFLRVTQAGDVAHVLLGWDPYDESGTMSGRWVDIHTLLRINGTWKMMAKTATHESRAGWAAKA